MTTETQTLCPICQGRQAFKNGDAPDANPFDMTDESISWSEWLLGYSAEKEVA